MTAPLRSLDWRFLLPAPSSWRSHAIILGGPPGIVARATCENIADEVTDRMSTHGRAGLVAALAGASDSVRAIAEALDDDGVLFIELPPASRPHASLARTTAALEAAGLVMVARYLVEPSHADARAYIPLDVPRALEWHRRVDRAEHPARRLARRARASAERIVPALAPGRRCHAIIASRTRRASSLPAVLHDPALRVAPGADLEGAVMQAYGGDRVIFFPFAPDSRDPVAVVKVPRTRALAARTVHERAEVLALRATLPPDLGAAIPEPSGTGSVHDVPVTAERYAPGVRLTTLAMATHRPLEAKAHDLTLAMDWLVRFQRATETARPPLRDIAAEWVRRPHERFERACAIGDAEQHLLRLADSACEVLGGRTVPIARQHRDFAVWNLLVTGERTLTVVDWEGTREGPGVIDAVHLVTTWLYACRLGRGDDDEPRSARDVFASPPAPDAESVTARSALARYADAIGLDQSLLPLAILTHRVELVLRRLDQMHLHSATGLPAELPEAATVRLLAGVGEPFPELPLR